MLFLELALIRWLAANVVHLGYFSNFVLLGSFLGVGLGFLRSNPDRGKPVYFPIALALLVAFVMIVPRHGRPRRQRPDLLHLRSRTTGRRRGSCCRWSSAAVAVDPGRTGRARRSVLPRAPAPRGLPLGPHRQPHRHLVVRAALVPAGPVGRVGPSWSQSLIARAVRADAATGAGAVRCRRGRRHAAVRVPRSGRVLVALLQGPHRRPRATITTDRESTACRTKAVMPHRRARAGRPAVPRALRADRQQPARRTC